MKPIVFVGGSLDEIRNFPANARREVGQQLGRVQHGLDPADWKPMSSIGASVRELRVRDESGAFRVIYIATFAEAVYVLHAFQKKAQRTAKQDIDVATRRLRQIRGGRSS
jgi:phage-related protein